MNFKSIHIGQMIEKRVEECGIELSRICNFMKSSDEEIQKMYESENLNTKQLLKWSKLLEYDFFRPYTQHLILYSPSSSGKEHPISKSSLPQFRKNIYTKELIDFILELIEMGQKTRNQIIEEYRIPKTTLHKWLNKYNRQ